ncbi:recombinase family protein [Glycomyces rutgersensis]|uniref:Recombinase family protein n=1 Tax=Glycomyces rutgersensis TaxID=58115 RepID=A0ABP5SI83_9ACTN
MTRLSKAADESTSIERQREAVELWAKLHGHEIIGEAVDNGVSGATSPFDREGFGEWLTDAKAAEFDIVCAWKLDRFSRSVSEFLKLADWMTEHGKQIATTDGTVDTTTPQGRFFTVLLSAMAEWERAMVSMRATSSQAKLRSLGRVHGSTAPFGYKTVRRDDGAYLEIDPETAQIAREMVNKRLAGMSQRQLAKWLNEKGVPTKYGKQWRQTSVSAILGSYALIGQRTSKGRLVTDESGTPIQFGEPLISFEKFQELRAFEDAQEVRKGPLTGPSYLLRGLITCASCGLVMYRSARGKGQPYSYVCSSGVRMLPCEAPQRIRADAVEPMIEALFLDEMGERHVLEPVFVPGEDHSRALEQVQANIDRTRAEADAGLWEGHSEDYMKRLTALTAERTRLEALPQRPDRIEMQPTAQTYAEAWASADVEERRKLLANLEAAAWIYGDPEAPSVEPPPAGYADMVTPLTIRGGYKWLRVKWKRPENEEVVLPSS